MSLVLGSGQLAVSSTTLLGAGAHDRVVSLTLYNTATTNETYSLTVAHAGETSRVVAWGVLGPGEGVYLNGLALDASDALAGQTSNASSVDYRLTEGQGAFSIMVYGADGTPKTASSLRRIALGLEALTGTELPDPGV